MRNWAIALVAVVVAHFALLPFMSPVFADIMIFAGVNIILAVSLNLVNGFTGQFSLGHAGFMSIGAYAAACPYPLSATTQGLSRQRKMRNADVLPPQR